jgi:hypothetical protein
VPEKVAQLANRRKLYLATIGELVQRAANGPADLRAWADSIPPSASKTKRSDPDVVDRESMRSLIRDTAARLETKPLSEVVSALKAAQAALQ